VEIAITLVREQGAPTVAICSEEPGIYVIRDASASDRDLLTAYADALEEIRNEPSTLEPASSHSRRGLVEEIVAKSGPLEPAEIAAARLLLQSVPDLSEPS
jgi:hypothetical protein